jgi:hypothetical protein
MIRTYEVTVFNRGLEDDYNFNFNWDDSNDTIPQMTDVVEYLFQMKK